MRIVLDTNVLVSGLLTPFGACGDVVRLLTGGAVTLCVDARILLEYNEVLRRPHFCMDPEKVDIVLDYIGNAAEHHAAAILDRALPDADDNAFLEVARGARVACLVTGNVRHFPVSCRAGIPVLSPQEFLAFIRRTGERHDP